MKLHKFEIIDKNGRKRTGTTLVPDPKPNPGTNHRYRTAKAEYTAQFLSGRHHNKSGGSMAKTETLLNHMQAYFTKHHGMKDSWKGMKKWQSDAFENYIKNQKSLLDGERLAPKTQKDLLGEYRKVMVTLGKEHMLPKQSYVARGIAVAAENVENPIDFKPTYTSERNTLQELLERCCNDWYPVASELGRAFGLRLAERMASRDVMWRVGNKLYATQKLGHPRQVSKEALAKRYGQSFADRLYDKRGNLKLKEGMKYLMVEDTKNGRDRIQPIYNEVRKAAIERLHDFIKCSPGRSEHKKVHPDRTNPETAQDNYSKYLRRHGVDRGTDLHSHGDRHWEAQRLFKERLDEGMTYRKAAREVVEELGHGPNSSAIWFYIPRPSSRH